MCSGIQCSHNEKEQSNQWGQLYSSVNCSGWLYSCYAEPAPSHLLCFERVTFSTLLRNNLCSICTITQSPPQTMLKGSHLAINKHMSALKPGPPSSLRRASAFHKTWRCGLFGEGKQRNVLTHKCFGELRLPAVWHAPSLAIFGTRSPSSVETGSLASSRPFSSQLVTGGHM